MFFFLTKNKGSYYSLDLSGVSSDEENDDEILFKILINYKDENYDILHETRTFFIERRIIANTGLIQKLTELSNNYNPRFNGYQIESVSSSLFTGLNYGEIEPSVPTDHIESFNILLHKALRGYDIDEDVLEDRLLRNEIEPCIMYVNYIFKKQLFNVRISYISKDVDDTNEEIYQKNKFTLFRQDILNTNNLYNLIDSKGKDIGNNQDDNEPWKVRNATFSLELEGYNEYQIDQHDVDYVDTFNVTEIQLDQDLSAFLHLSLGNFNMSEEGLRRKLLNGEIKQAKFKVKYDFEYKDDILMVIFVTLNDHGEETHKLIEIGKHDMIVDGLNNIKTKLEMWSVTQDLKIRQKARSVGVELITQRPNNSERVFKPKIYKMYIDHFQNFHAEYVNLLNPILANNRLSFTHLEGLILYRGYNARLNITYNV